MTLQPSRSVVQQHTRKALTALHVLDWCALEQKLRDAEAETEQLGAGSDPCFHPCSSVVSLSICVAREAGAAFICGLRFSVYRLAIRPPAGDARVRQHRAPAEQLEVSRNDIGQMLRGEHVVFGK